MTEANSEAHAPEPRETIRWSLVIFACALLVRGVHVWQLNDSVFGDLIMGDALTYDRWAREIAAGTIGK